MVAAARRMPKMHWRWRDRGRDIVSLFESRFGRVLPDDDAGMDAVRLLAQHYLGLNVGAEQVTKTNLRLWAPWLTDIARVMNDTGKAKTPSAAQLGRQWRVTAEEVVALGLTTITAYTVTQDGERTRQARRRRKAGAGTKRGRPKSVGLKPWQIAGASSKAAYYRNLKRAETSETENSHGSSYTRGMQRDEFRSHSAAPRSAAPHAMPTVIEVLEAVEAELLPELKITVPIEPDVIDLIPLPAADRRAQARRPFRPGLLEQFRAQGMAMFGGAR
jgi:hypothetical protein